MDFSQYFEAVTQAKSVEELYPLLIEAVEKICGFNRVTFRLLTDHNLINLPANHGISKNYPEDWMAHYQENGFDRIDPVSRYGLRASLPFTWQEVAQKMKFNKQQAKCFNGGIEAGLNHGIAVPLRSGFGQVAGVAAAVDENNPYFDEQRQIAKMNLVCQHFYFRFLQLYDHNSQRISDIPRLSPQERDVVAWTARGKSAEEVAQILNLSAGTVNWYMNAVRTKYNASNRLTAILSAIHFGEIDMNELLISKKLRVPRKKCA